LGTNWLRNYTIIYKKTMINDGRLFSSVINDSLVTSIRRRKRRDRRKEGRRR